MTKKIDDIEVDGQSEAKRNENARKIRERKVKHPNPNIEDQKVLNHGFVSFF